jgi:hypothetical protein
MSEVRNEIGNFTITPEWVINDICHSEATYRYQALAVYNYLGCRANKNDKTCYPCRSTIAEHCNISVSTVDRCIKLLVELGALTYTNQYTDKGEFSSNLYTVKQIPTRASHQRLPSVSPDAETIVNKPIDYKTKKSRSKKGEGKFERQVDRWEVVINKDGEEELIGRHKLKPDIYEKVFNNKVAEMLGINPETGEMLNEKMEVKDNKVDLEEVEYIKKSNMESFHPVNEETMKLEEGI